MAETVDKYLFYIYYFPKKDEGWFLLFIVILLFNKVVPFCVFVYILLVMFYKGDKNGYVGGTVEEREIPRYEDKQGFTALW